LLPGAVGLYVGLQLVLVSFGPVAVTRRGEEEIYTHQHLYPLLLNGAAVCAGAWLCWRHLRAYGWRRTFRTETGAWEPGMRASFTGALLFPLGLGFLALTLWGVAEAKFAAVSPAGFAVGSGDPREAGPSAEVRFRDLRSIDFDAPDAFGRRGWFQRRLRCVDRAGGERFFPRDRLINAAVPRIAEEAERAGVTLLNY
jgi:hypothetical protein